MRHLCHAHGCNIEVPPSMLACKPHWYALPKKYRDAIWREYRRGQEKDRRVSYRYYAVQRLAISGRAFKPHDEQAAAVSGNYMTQALMWQSRSISAGLGDPLEGLVPK